MVKLAHDLSLTVVCEGIETDEQLKMVRDWQTDMIQGNLISESKPWHDFFPDYKTSS
jgi:EAL domain-containing protein (putative c-di-GMP-specific phosphodiesterase class I)